MIPSIFSAPVRAASLVGVMLVASLQLAGCAETGPVLVPVAGRVTLDGQPLANGSVTLRPVATEDGWEQPTGSIEPDGTYTVYTQRRPGAPPGKYRVVIFATATTKDTGGAAHPGLPKSVIPAVYSDPQETPLTVDLDPGKKATFHWELSSDGQR